MKVTLRVVADAPDEALESLYDYLAEDLALFAQVRPEKVHSALAQNTLAGGALVEILLVIGTVNAAQSAADAARTVKSLAGKLHGFLSEHRSQGVKAVTVSTEEGGTATVADGADPAEAEAALRRAIAQPQSPEEQHGTEAS